MAVSADIRRQLTGGLRPHSTAETRFEIFSLTIPDSADFAVLVVTTGSARIATAPQPHAPTWMPDHWRADPQVIRSDPVVVTTVVKSAEYRMVSEKKANRVLAVELCDSTDWWWSVVVSGYLLRLPPDPNC